MQSKEIAYLFNQFDHGSEFESYSELNSGHINDTYLVKTAQKPYYILQRINHNVFKDVPGLIANKVNVSRHISEKLSHLSEDARMRKVLSFINAKNGEFYYIDKDGNYWNMMVFIDESQTFETVTKKEIAYEGGKLFGHFLNLASDFDASKLTEVIPNFHSMTFRFSQFEDALRIASPNRLDQAKECIEKAEELREEMLILQHLKDEGKIKLRVTHNDTKISNALFDKNNKGLCVIDTDTVMPGIIHYDFGDAIRTICNTAAEDEKNLALVNFNIEYYHAYVKGFLEEIGSSLTPLEKKYLPLGAKTMIFIMALRFLTDFLNNDVYYKTEYPEHNLNRAKNQFKLIESFEKHFTPEKV
ncbi:aminoglycoside phosphotransferase family protein [Aureibaculum sp. 2210JD6-5]|uniref:phosphotransferase enzyme family protein n=1 Tax=Aureibaculum sp. 2210JD6-5 TaxID=3103957 RepID=UPI002AAD756D|nr:aminoglycoside phosphotransferase family protein [Aureibaculum sp. 2210JD6-5]MDY7396051.1 aminoglycoside phosphotransferase family protein [Aureibaculum sp. 2210JD6-5]